MTLKSHFTGIIVVILLWWVLSLFNTGGVLPGPLRVMKALVVIVQSEGFWTNVRDSFIRVFLGTLISLFLGTLLGVMGGMVRFFREAVHPLMVMMESVPPMAWIVLAILWFHIGPVPSVVAAVASATPIAFFNTVEGVKNINSHYVELAKIYHLSLKKRLRAIYLPGIIPVIVATLSTNFSLNWRVVIMAEALSAYTGLGQGLWGTYLFGEMETVFAYVVVIALMGLVVEYGVLNRFKQGLVKKYHFQ
ncbi:MAG: hypothetical protein AVO33_08140 [delta proteobacterium ML8_F1]|nr:MAG: hypothetical protein AVO33_08140 [delta proteobacterium ML8_F1]